MERIAAPVEPTAQGLLDTTEQPLGVFALGPQEVALESDLGGVARTDEFDVLFDHIGRHITYRQRLGTPGDRPVRQNLCV